MSTGLAIFVKTPGRSPVKTRLAADLGAEFAAAWHRRAAAVVAAVARETERRSPAGNPLCAYWAVAEAAAIAGRDWPGFDNLAQGSGGLGERMAGVYRQLFEHHRAGLLIGADAPQICSDDLLAAAEWLGDPSPRFVIGPARDGGFWLFGGNRPLPLSVWTRVAYSQADTARRFAEGLAGQGEWLHLPMRCDLDHASDLPAVLDELRALPRPLPEQGALADWLCGLELLHDG